MRNVEEILSIESEETKTAHADHAHPEQHRRDEGRDDRESDREDVVDSPHPRSLPQS